MTILILLAGLVFGSFISAITWRIPRGIKILDLKSRSICPKCKKEISWYDNIPLLSFILLGGKCRCCNKHISWRYPIIELATGIGFLVIFTLQGLSLQGVYSIVIFLILEAIFVIDFEHQIIPDDLVFIGFALCVFLIPNFSFPISNLFAGFACASILLFIHFVTNGKGMGLGDVKFAILGGIIVGLRLSLIWLFLSFLTGAVIGIILILGKKAGLKSQIAFGPFLIIAIPITLVFGNVIIKLMGLP